MSGHSKWATTKRAKAIVDAKRGATFTRLANLITITAKKGADPETNFSLRMAIDKARAANMPKENIERAIKRALGSTGEGELEELIYEAIGPGNVQLIIKCHTDNRNRTAAMIRHLLSKHGGALSSVMWNFRLAGVIMISAEKLHGYNLEEIELKLIDGGANDLWHDENGLVVYSEIVDLPKLQKILQDIGLQPDQAEVEYVAKDRIFLNQEGQIKFQALSDALQELDEVSAIYTNLE